MRLDYHLELMEMISDKGIKFEMDGDIIKLKMNEKGEVIGTYDYPEETQVLDFYDLVDVVDRIVKQNVEIQSLA